MLFELAAIILPLIFVLGFSEYSRWVWLEDHSLGFIRLSGEIVPVSELQILPRENNCFLSMLTVHLESAEDRTVALIVRDNPDPSVHIPMIAESYPPEHEDCQDFLEVDDEIDGDCDGNQFYIFFWRCSKCQTTFDMDPDEMEHDEPDYDAYREEELARRNGGEY